MKTENIKVALRRTRTFVQGKQSFACSVAVEFSVVQAHCQAHHPGSTIRRVSHQLAAERSQLFQIADFSACIVTILHGNSLIGPDVDLTGIQRRLLCVAAKLYN